MVSGHGVREDFSLDELKQFGGVATAPGHRLKQPALEFASRGNPADRLFTAVLEVLYY